MAAVLDLVDWPAERTMRVSGPPSSLRVSIMLSNGSDTALAAGEPVLIELKGASGEPLAVRSVGSVPAVAAGSTAPGRLRIRLDPATPPGSYEGRLVVAGVARPLRIDVVATVALSVGPAPLVIDVAQGLAPRAVISVVNSGNVPLTIDLTGDYPLGEEMPLLIEGAAAPEAAEGIDRLLALFHAPTHRTPPLREAGMIGIAMPDGAALVAPGATATVAIDLAIPATLSATARYRAFVPVYDQDLAIMLVTAAKSISPGPSTRPRSKGEVQ